MILPDTTRNLLLVRPTTFRPSVITKASICTYNLPHSDRTRILSMRTPSIVPVSQGVKFPAPEGLQKKCTHLTIWVQTAYAVLQEDGRRTIDPSRQDSMITIGIINKPGGSRSTSSVLEAFASDLRMAVEDSKSRERTTTFAFQGLGHGDTVRTDIGPGAHSGPFVSSPRNYA